jgi:TolA-binding protein
MRAGIIGIVALTVMMVQGIVVGASTPNLAGPSAAAEPNERSVPPRWTCIPDMRRCPAMSNDSDGAGKSSGEPKVSPEMESVLKIAEGTLQGVREHTDFLATLWKWSTIVATIAVFVIAGLGITTVRDLRKVRDEAVEVVKQANQSVTEMQSNIDKLSKEITSNFMVIMNCSNLQPAVDDIESQRAKLGAAALTDAAFKKRESDTYGNVVKQLSTVLREHPPTDPAVASFADDFLGFAEYRMGNVSTALALAKRSLAFKENNATALYNAASYAASLRLLDTSLGFLERAIEQNQNYASIAKTDEDFDPLRGLPKFMVLVGS